MNFKDMLHSDNAFVNFFVPQNGDSKKTLIRKYSIYVIIILIIVGIIISCCYISAQHKHNDIANAMNQSALVTSINTPSSKSWSVIGEVESCLQNMSSTLSSISSESSSQIVSTNSKTNPNKMEPMNPPENYLEEFKVWFKTNRDVKGRLIVPNTHVNYPVTQTNNNTFYLNHNEYRASSGWGVPFMDYRSSIVPNKQSTNIIIYGHSDDKRGLQLSGIKNYKNLDFYKQNPVIQFDTAYERGQWKVIGFFLEDVSDKNPIGPFEYHNFVNATSEADFNNFVEAVRERSFYDTPVDSKYGDRFLTISTCYSLTSKDFRYVFVARKVRDGESTSVDTSSAVLNEDRLVPKRAIQ
ncbi:class B sortase [Paludicola sp. MB14-C6]|uniref:class B sortase n=1 Tax=Paludihabitans sp. MB14-C6 TaxID=3070656 RepID=UPI0027DAE195|nr:class B sortase [Paludicola sp. MB14-C6]WMJ22128.1 class B sortase [Paludicola sp. MB14-C6]